MEKKYELALEKIKFIKEEYEDLKEQYLIMRTDYKELLKRNLYLAQELENMKDIIDEMEDM